MSSGSQMFVSQYEPSYKVPEAHASIGNNLHDLQGHSYLEARTAEVKTETKGLQLSSPEPVDFRLVSRRPEAKSGGEEFKLSQSTFVDPAIVRGRDINGPGALGDVIREKPVGHVDYNAINRALSSSNIEPLTYTHSHQLSSDLHHSHRLQFNEGLDVHRSTASPLARSILDEDLYSSRLRADYKRGDWDWDIRSSLVRRQSPDCHHHNQDMKGSAISMKSSTFKELAHSVSQELSHSLVRQRDNVLSTQILISQKDKNRENVFSFARHSPLDYLATIKRNSDSRMSLVQNDGVIPLFKSNKHFKAQMYQWWF